jgi:hypothetical protein
MSKLVAKLMKLDPSLHQPHVQSAIDGLLKNLKMYPEELAYSVTQIYREKDANHYRNIYVYKSDPEPEKFWVNKFKEHYLYDSSRELYIIFPGKENIKVIKENSNG